jgi:hypothetical protein
MKKNFWQLMKIAPALVGAGIIATSPAQAGEEVQLINQLNSYSSEGFVSSEDQVTSVSQLRDVSPTDWAYEALRSLVERYGCIVGYPDSTFRGNRALSRYEFAAGLNACMQQMERLISASEAVLKEDIAKLQRLMSEFEAELAALGARVDNLEGRVAFLEDHQFSTTTKLKGEVILGLSQEFNDNQAILANRVRLALHTSFTGEDLLITRIAAGSDSRFTKPNNIIENEGGGDGDSPILSNFTTPATTQNWDVGSTGDNDAFVDWIAYYTAIKLDEDSKIDVYIAGYNGIHSDYVNTLNPYFEDYDGGNGALSAFATESPIYRIGSGSGIGLSYEFDFLKGVTLTAGYLASEAESPADGDGLFNGEYAALAQIDANITDNFAIGFTYVNGYHQQGSNIFGGLTGSNFANNGLLNYFDEDTFPFDGVFDRETHSFGAELAWRISEKVSFSGFFSYTNVSYVNFDSFGQVDGGDFDDDDEIWTYGGGFAFPDFGKEGNLLGIFAGVQPYSGDLAGLSDTSLPIHVEAFYKYQVNDNISITPGVIWISSPDQFDEVDDAIIGTLRTTFTF